MKQLIQNFKTGELYIDQVPLPAISEKMVLVENKFSLISAGTERGTVSVGQAGLLGKARKRPDLVKQVVQNVKKEGLKATYQKVRTKLDSLKALGYSTSGVVLASLDSHEKFKPGERVACAGQDYASHAEVVSVPQNLVAKIPDNVSFEQAAFTTLGAIALQGVRQAAPTLGEAVCVIGLGLLGQITCQLLKANGCRVFGIDPAPAMVEIANRSAAATAMSRNHENLLAAAKNFSGGYGFDKVIVTAATQSNDPVELSAELLKKKGALVIVGDVKMDIPRNPHFYRKELELRMSCSYGPGRYDASYEEQGHDYPFGYVRWTEQRNMQAFLELISQGAIDLKPLISHVFEIEKALEAYDLVLGKNQEPYTGILLQYSENHEKKQSYALGQAPAQKAINAAFIGAGSFAQSYLIPYVSAAASLDTVVTRSGMSAKNVMQKFGFAKASTNANDVFENEKINTVFIATRHNTHAGFVAKALQNKLAVFVEKPLAITAEGLEKVRREYENNPDSRLLVGFNRRFAPLSVAARQCFEGIGEPLAMNFRVNAGFIPKSHWTQSPDQGGGRIVGEVCHFIDLMQFFCGSLPKSIFARQIASPDSEMQNQDNLAVSVSFADGSVGNLSYLANGDKSLPKEELEIFGGGKVFRIHDFRQGSLHENSRKKTLKMPGKGHKQEVEAFVQSILQGTASPISFESVCFTTRATFKILDSLKTGLPQELG